MISIKVDTKEVERALGDMAKKMPSAVARGLTLTAQDAKKQVQGWLPRLIDRPTGYTMNSLFVFPAEKNDLRAAVAFKDEWGKMPRHAMENVNASRSMRMQVFGGQRLPKESEKTLLANGILGKSMFLVPAKGAKRDRFGNVPGSFMNQVMFTGVKRGSASQGYSVPLNGRGQGSSSRGQFFVMRKQGVAVGIYKNMGKRAAPMPVFNFASKAQYKKRVPFYQIAQAEIDRKLQQRINESIDVIIRKYRG